MRASGSDCMLTKIVLLFLAFVAVLGMFGKLHWLGGKRLQSAKCPECGRYRIGKGPCACRRDRG
jgi:hypothetical protein